VASANAFDEVHERKQDLKFRYGKKGENLREGKAHESNGSTKKCNSFL
jgi:hypothetical protein